MQSKEKGKGGDGAAVRDVLLEMGLADGRSDALYRRIAGAFGLGRCEMWLFYWLLADGGAAAQHELAERLSFPKQTVHSAVAKLATEGLVALGPAPGSRKEKTVRLTAAGRVAAEATSGRLLAAEVRATERLGLRKAAAFNRVRDEYFALLRDEFERDFLGGAGDRASTARSASPKCRT